MSFPKLDAQSPVELLGQLGRWIEHWYGPRQAEFGDSEEQLRQVALPEPLRRFYAFAGRWPSRDPNSLPTFYAGAGGHHLFPVDQVRDVGEGKLQFFMEYQGEWNGLTLAEGEDPPVWLFRPGRRYDATELISQRLSRFLVTHVLMATLYESINHSFSSTDDGLIDEFVSSVGGSRLLWSAEDCDCPHYQGLVHEAGECLIFEGKPNHRRLVARDPEQAKELLARQTRLWDEAEASRPPPATIDRHAVDFYRPIDGLEERLVSLTLVLAAGRAKQAWVRAARELADSISDPQVPTLLDRYDRFQGNLVPSSFRPGEPWTISLQFAWTMFWHETLEEVVYQARERLWPAAARAAFTEEHLMRRSAFSALCRWGLEGLQGADFLALLRERWPSLSVETREAMVRALLERMNIAHEPDPEFVRQVEALWTDPEFDRVRDRVE